MKTIYLDHAATTYLDPRVKEAMEPFWEENFGNPSSAYSIGRTSFAALQDARETIAELLNAKPTEVFFMAGGTESVNTAIFGVAHNYNTRQQPYHIITTTIEHSAVLKSCKQLEQEGYAISRVNVDHEGVVKLEELQNAVTPETILISVMYANNEIGTVQPIQEIAVWLKEVNAQRATAGLPTILLHTDACQAAGALDIDVHKLGVDLLTLNGSKMYGPKQTGLLYVREGITIQPLLFGGGQEQSVRSGTENVPGIVGLAKALELVQQARSEENERLLTLRQSLFEGLQKNIPDVHVNGPAIITSTTDPLKRLPNNVHLSFKHVDGQALLLYLDHHGICVSTGSACSAKSQILSHVLLAIDCPEEYIGGSIRFTLGKRTTQEQIEYTIETVTKALQLLRGAGE